MLTAVVDPKPMSSHSFSTLDGYTVSEAIFDETRFSGGPMPSLHVPLQLLLKYPQKKADHALHFLTLQARFSAVNHPCLALPVAVSINSWATPDYTDHKEHVPLEISLRPEQLGQLEKIRNGGDMRLRFHLELFLNELVKIGMGTDSYPRPIWGFKEHHSLTAQFEVTIPQSIWINQVLERTNYGKIHLVEFPAIALEKAENWQASFQALKASQELHNIGLYDDAVGKCRLALERFFEPEDQVGADNVIRRVPVLKKSWQKKLGEATHEWLTRSFSGLKGAMNVPLHQTGPHYDQFDSQMIFAVTTALVAYVARNVPPDTK